MNIRIRISELVLYDLDLADPRRISPAVQRELASLVARRESHLNLAGGGHIAFLKGRAPRSSRGTLEQTIASGIAEAVYQGLDGAAKTK